LQTRISPRSEPRLAFRADQSFSELEETPPRDSLVLTNPDQSATNCGRYNPPDATLGLNADIRKGLDAGMRSSNWADCSVVYRWDLGFLVLSPNRPAVNRSSQRRTHRRLFTLPTGWTISAVPQPTALEKTIRPNALLPDYPSRSPRSATENLDTLAHVWSKPQPRGSRELPAHLHRFHVDEVNHR
jgi:hypothetical protein